MTHIINEYPLKSNRCQGKKKQYAIGMLVYPGRDDNSPKWNYLFGACMISHQLKKNVWFKNNCDIIILTPDITDKNVISLIYQVFDVHVIYSISLNLIFLLSPTRHCGGVVNTLPC